LCKNEIKKVIFFIHGYNVPYSLAVFQNKVLIDQITSLDSTIRMNEILLISVYWPSGNRKNDYFESSECDYSNFKNPKTAIAFTYYSNRAYLSAVYLRRIIREMQCNVPIDIITHSHGSTLATSALINTTTKLQDGDLSDGICDLLQKEEFPDKEINVFLNAPSIPGVLTFIDVEQASIQQKYRFFVGYNIEDDVLKKQMIKIDDYKLKIAPTGYISLNLQQKTGQKVKLHF
jgi:esterase/lipase superfamily enzyme